MADYDSAWKEALDRYFQFFMAFFFPLAHADIDWARGYEFLDKELQQIASEAEQGRRYVDKLVKVWLKGGKETWLLIHVEVQTWKEAEFPRRMHTYNQRIADKYNREVISLAILGDDDPEWRPSSYGYGRWGFHTGTEFPAPKLLDYAKQWEVLEASTNPFAVVTMAHLKSLETRRSSEDRQAWKVRLVKGLHEHGMSAEDIRQLWRFIDWMMDLPLLLETVFWQEMDRYEKEKQMPFITSVERIGMARGLLLGLEAVLEVKFGAEGLKLMSELQPPHDHEKLQQILQAAKTATSLNEVRALVGK